MRLWVGVLGAILAMSLSSTAEARTRISRENARYAARVIWANEAELYHQRLIITPCVPHGRSWRVCRVRFGSERHTIKVRYQGVAIEALLG
jgi:hypothetical protein